MQLETMAAVRSGRQGRGQALIMVLAWSGIVAEATRRLAELWQDQVPDAAFAGLGVPWPQTDAESLRARITEEAHAMGLEPSQVVLVAWGALGWIAVNFCIRGLLPAAGLLGLNIDIQTVPSDIAAGTTKIRLIQRNDPEPSGQRLHRRFVGAIEGGGIDIRSMIMPCEVPREVLFRGASAYLVELVATASWSQRRFGGAS